MIPYILPFLFIFFKATKKRQYFTRFDKVAVIFFLIFFVGLKTEITPDWDNYQLYADEASGLSLSELISKHAEIGYSFLLWLSSITKTGIYGVNALCAAIFSFGLVQYCAKQKYPWLSLAVAYPYLIVAVAFGFTRQSATIGFSFLAISAYEDGKIKSFLAFMLAAVLYHISGMFTLLIPISYYFLNLNKLRSIIYLAILIVLVYFAYQLNARDIYTAYDFYFSTSNRAPGAFIKLAML